MNLDGKTHPKSSSTKERIKKKSQAIFYKCKKPEHLKSKCPKLEKAKDKKKSFKSKRKKSVIRTQDYLDDTTSYEQDDEEANLRLMIDLASEESELEQDKEVNFDDPKSLKQTYYELFSNS